MIGRNIQRRKIMKIVFNFRPQSHIKTGAGKNSFNPLARACHRMQAARCQTAARQRHVHRLCLELFSQNSIFQRNFTCFQCLLHSLLGLVNSLTRCRPFVSRQLSEPLELLGQLTFFTQECNTHRIERSEIFTAPDIGLCALDQTGQRIVELLHIRAAATV